MITKYVTNIYEITDSYQKILIDAKEANVNIISSSDAVTKLVFFEDKKRQYVFDVQNDTLTIRLQKTKWYKFLRICFKHPKINIHIPKSVLEALSLNATVGSIDISSITCKEDINIQTNTGKVNIYDSSCKNFNLKSNTGNITLNKLIATNSVSMQCKTGKISLNDCNARKFFVKTNTGNVFGKLPSNTVFVVKTNTGKIEIPKATIGEIINARCEVKTNTGNIVFK